MSSTFKLKVNPTFKLKVAIPVHGGLSEPVEFEFKHRSRTEMDAWLKEIPDMKNVDFLQTFVVGWDLEDPYNSESIALLTDNYLGSTAAVTDAYTGSIYQAREKN